MPTLYNHNGRHSAGEETHRRQQRIFELRRDHVSFPQIGWILAQEEGREYPYTQGWVYKMYKRGLKQIIAEDVQEVRKMELARLDALQEEVLKVLHGFNPLVNRGTIVRDFLEDEKGNLILDESGEPIPVKLQDLSVKLNAVNAAVKLMERRARLLGLDAPTKVAATDPTGEKEATFVSLNQMTHEQLAEEAKRRGLPLTIFEE